MGTNTKDIDIDLVKRLTAPAHALAGAGGGVLSLGVTYPLFTLITKLQVKSTYAGPVDAFFQIIREEGWKGLYSGLTIALVGNAYAQGVYYYWYSFLRTWAEGRGPVKKKVGTLMSLFIGALAGAITVFFTNPIWVITTRLQTTKETSKKDGNPERKGVLETALEVYKENGILGFWNGLIPALILVSNPAIQYMVFEQTKLLLERKRKPLTSIDHFFLGSFAKTVATVATYPYLTVKTRLQAKGKYLGTLDVLVRVLREEGISGIYKGMESKIVQSVLTAALLFALQNKLADYFLRLLLALYGRRPPK
jgi:adenine nucleotide transporter 17